MKEYATKIVNWYEQNKRFLPWRESQTPYHVWISEIMLQQTRIEAVKKYYQRFIQEIPDIQTLANVDDDKLLKLWEGLGYYSRAKNLKKAAMQIMNEYQGTFPTTYVEILKLPGIGEYTASAIASICFGEKQITIDGNVLRIYARINNDNRPIDDIRVKNNIREELLKIVPDASGSFNQGLMEIGETICLPKGEPKCHICPLKEICEANHKRTYQSLPVKLPKKEKKEEYYTIILFHFQEKYAIYKRSNETLLNNLWSFPTITSNKSALELKEYLKENKIAYKRIIPSITNCHIFTHKKWQMISYLVELESINNLENYQFASLEELIKNYCIPSAYQPFLKELKRNDRNKK